MMRFLETLGSVYGYLMPGAFIVLGIIAAVRVYIKMKRGEKVELTPVGAVKDMPSSVTGMNKHEDSEVYGRSSLRDRDGE